MKAIAPMSLVQYHMRPRARISAHRLKGTVAAAIMCFALGCNQGFPAGSPAENGLLALLTFGNFRLSPDSLPFVAAGASYQFRLTGGIGSPKYSVSDCSNGSINETSGLFRAPPADAACIVTGTDSSGATRSATVTVQTYPTLIKSRTRIHSYFPLDTNHADASGNAVPSTATPGPVMTYGTNGALDTTIYPSNGRVTLDGINEAITNITGFDPATEATDQGFSAEVWFRVANADTVVSGQVLPLLRQQSCGAGTARVWLGIDANGQDQIISQIGGVTSRSGVVVKTNRNYHAVVTVKGTSLRLYVNGLLRLSTTVVPESCSAANPLSIGAVGGNLFSGSIDEVAFYRTELSAADVTQHYLTALARTVSIDETSIYSAYGNARSFLALGGVPPYSYADGTSLTGDSINSSTGLYTAPTLQSTSKAEAAEAIYATDAAGNTAQFTTTVAAFPNSFPTLQAWYSNEVVTDKTNTNPVPLLLDISGTGVHLSNFLTTPPQYRLPSASGLNGNGSIEYPSGERLSTATAGFGTTGDLTIVLLAFPGNNMVLLSHDGLGGTDAENVNYQLRVSGLALDYRHEVTFGVFQTATGPAVTTGAWNLLAMRRSVVGASSTITLAVNGTAAAPTMLGLAGDGSAGVLHLGFSYPGHGGLANYTGRIAEVAIYHRALSNSEITQLTCYYKLKYNLSAVVTTCP